MDQLLPIGEIALGAGLLVVSLMIHGVGMYLVQRRFDRCPASRSPSRLARQYLFGTLIVMMLATHLVEAMVWSAALVFLGAIPSLRDAFYYATATYTTLGYGEGTLPPEWRILAPMIAMSGLFAFGWTTGVLVNIVHRPTRTSRQARADRSRRAGPPARLQPLANAILPPPLRTPTLTVSPAA